MAKFLNEEKTFISKDFYYSTEIKIANAVNIYQIMLMIFPENWHLARLGAIIVNNLIFVMGFVYMSKAVTTDLPIMIIALSALLEKLGVTEIALTDVVDVSFSNPVLVEVSKIEAAEGRKSSGRKRGS